MKKKEDIVYICVLQFIGPIFVILGHSLNGLECNNLWFTFTKQWIYIFHMPLFFMISGYLLSFNGWLNNKSYVDFILGKAKRLLLPYFVWNLLFVVPKCLLESFISDETPQNFFEAVKLFFFPRQAIWGHTWFLMGLFLLFLFAPIIQKLVSTFPIALLFVALLIILFFIPINTEFLALSVLHEDILYFIIGCLLGQMDKEVFLFNIKKYRLINIILAMVTSILAVIYWEETANIRLIPCFFILMSLFSIASSIKSIPLWCKKMSKNSFAIYIMHWPVMLVVRIVFYQVLNFNVGLASFLMIMFGYFIPTFIIYLIRKVNNKGIKLLAKYLLGA